MRWYEKTFPIVFSNGVASTGGPRGPELSAGLNDEPH